MQYFIQLDACESLEFSGFKIYSFSNSENCPELNRAFACSTLFVLDEKPGASSFSTGEDICPFEI
jgi:hypothetical protein